MRTECLYNNELIHIADFFTTKDGMQIAIEGKIEELREYGRSGQLVCGCGCGGKVKLVSGKNMIRRQHFRLKAGQNVICKSHEESPITVNAKVILKCWLDDVLGLQNGEVLFNIPINKIGDINRKYEYTHLVVSKKIGICYERNESNLNDEKIELLSSKEGMTNLCITDIKNDGCWGQYPEFGIKVQKMQGYYALLTVGELTPYEEAVLKIVRYEKTYRGTWIQMDVCESKLSEYSFDENNMLCLNGSNIYDMAKKRSDEYISFREEQKRLAREQEEREKREAEERRAEIDRLFQEKRKIKEKEAEERNAYWEKYKEEKELRENSYTEIKPEISEPRKVPTIEDVLEQNPKIGILMEYISGLNTLGGTFTYVSKADRSSVAKYEVIKIKDVKFNPHRMRIEIISDSGERYIIYLRTENRSINTQYTRDGYLIFSLYGLKERDTVLKFRQVLECNGEKYVERYLCTLDYFCPYKGEKNNICTLTSNDNKCSYRECIKEYKNPLK